MKTLQKSGPYFKVLNLSDPQLGNWEMGQKNAQVLAETVTRLVAEVKPDLITVSGDLAWAGHYAAYANFADLLDGFQIPWQRP